MPTPAAHPVPVARRRSALDRAKRWALRHPFLTYVAVVGAATIIAWACEYATGGVPAALCHLRDMLQARLGDVVEQVLRRPLAP
jgi:hypothetical protein